MEKCQRETKARDETSKCFAVLKSRTKRSRSKSSTPRKLDWYLEKFHRQVDDKCTRGSKCSTLVERVAVAVAVEGEGGIRRKRRGERSLMKGY